MILSDLDAETLVHAIVAKLTAIDIGNALMVEDVVRTTVADTLMVADGILTPDLALVTPCNAQISHGPGHQSLTRCEVKKPGHRYHYAANPMSPGWEWEGDGITPEERAL